MAQAHYKALLEKVLLVFIADLQVKEKTGLERKQLAKKFRAISDEDFTIPQPILYPSKKNSFSSRIFLF